MPDLFDYSAPQYPAAPGFKGTHTSQEAAAEIAPVVPMLRGMVLQYLRTKGPMAPDECAARMGLSILSVRPRFSELKADGAIVDTGERRTNQSGRKAIVWRAA